MNFKPVTLPTKDYVFFSSNETLGSIMSTGRFHSKNQIGDVFVEARDTAIDSNRAENIVHIVEPSSLEIDLYDITAQVKEEGLTNYAAKLYNAESDSEIQSLSKKKVEYSGSWILVEERYYLFNFILHDEKLHEIQLTENLLFELSLNKEFLQVFDKTQITITKEQHSNLYIVKALKEVKTSPAVGKLDKVVTTDKDVYKFKYNSLKVTRNVQITSQIQIIHPTSEIRLPYLGYYKRPSFDIGQQIWQLPITGGTGEYTWTTEDANVAFVRSDASIPKTGEIHGHHLGQTVITVYDRKNLFNYASIPVYVTKVYSLVWLESKIEIPMGGNADYSSLIAYDDHGFKYTNCSSLIFDYNMGDEDSNIVALKTQRLSWKETGTYVQDNLDIVKLRYRFDQNIDALLASSLPKDYTFNNAIELHNNFGICATDKFETNSEGLARVKANLPINFDTQEYPSKVESEVLKIASYFVPVTISPDYSKLFDDLMYPNQPIQHANIFSQYYQSDVFKISYGSSLYWVFNGGTNYWTDDIYSFSHKITKDGYGLDVNCLSENLPPLANRVTYQFT